MKQVLIYQMLSVVFVIAIIITNFYCLNLVAFDAFFITIGELLTTAWFFWGVSKASEKILNMMNYKGDEK